MRKVHAAATSRGKSGVEDAPANTNQTLIFNWAVSTPMAGFEGGLTKVRLRPGKEADAAELGRICFEAFRDIAMRHNYPPDFPNRESVVQVISHLLAAKDVYSVVAEIDGELAGSNFMDERDPVFGIGPISIDPSRQNSGLGRLLMLDALKRYRMRGAPGVRLVQAAYHTRSLALYTKLGFVTRESLSNLSGKPPSEEVPGRVVTTASEEDIEACNRICFKVHGVTRENTLRAGIASGTALVVRNAGKVAGYTTGLSFFGYSVAETNDDMRALISSVKAFGGPGIIVPTRNHDLLTWCLERGLRINQQLTLMTVGLYSEPAGSYMPSVLY